MNKRIVLVGASGQVGQLVSANWKDELAQSPVCVRQYRAKTVVNTPYQLRWDPLAGSDAICDWVATYGDIAAMIVLAGITPRTGGDLSLNAIIADRCLEAAKAAGVPRVLIASSSAVYGLGNGEPFAEASVCKPANLYGESKLAMEQVCIEWRHQGIDVSCLRIGNVAGADALLLNLIKANDSDPAKIDIFDDGRGPIRSYLGPESLANVLTALVAAPSSLPPIINIAAPTPIAMEDLAICAGYPWEPRYVADNRGQRIVLDCSLLDRFYSFAPVECEPAEMIRQWENFERR